MTTAVEERLGLYRRLVLDGAEREFGRVGYADARMQDVARAAGLSLATVYKTYAGKAAIWDALHADRMAQLLAHVDATTGDHTSPRERVVDGIAAVARFLVDRADYLEMNLRAGASWTSPVAAGGVQGTVWSTGLGTVEQAVRAAIAAGEVPSVRPRATAALLVSVLQIWLSDWVAAGRDLPADAVLEEITEALERVLPQASIDSASTS